jgi:hypothetical protein
MGNIGVQETMQGDLSKLIEAPFRIAQIIVSINKDLAEGGRNRTIAKMQKHKLKQLKEDEMSGNVSLKNLNRSGDDLSKLSDLDKSCYKVLKKNLDETGIKYHVNSFKDEDGKTSFSILFEDKNAPKVQQAVEKSLRQMQNPKFMKKMQQRPSVLDNLKKAKEKTAEINKNLHEKNKHQEQSR